MTPWKSEALKKQLEEETDNLLRWEADEEVANKELDAKLKHVGEVKALQNTEINALEKQNEILRRRVAAAEQKKEEIQRKALFTQRKADVLLERFNMVTNDVERVQSRGPVAKVFFSASINGILHCRLGGQKLYIGENEIFRVKCGLNADPFWSFCGLESSFSSKFLKSSFKSINSIAHFARKVRVIIMVVQ